MHVPGARREIRARQAQMPARKKRGGSWFRLRGGRFPLTPVRKRQDTDGAHCGRSREWKMRKVLPAPCARAFFAPARSPATAESAGRYVRGMHVPGTRREMRARQAQMPACKKRGGAWFRLRGGRFPLTPVRKRQDTDGAHCGRSREWKMRKVLPAPCARAFFAPAGGTGSGADGEPHCQSH